MGSANLLISRGCRLVVSSGPNPPTTMLDLILAAAAVAFFVLCVAYVWFCEKVR